MFTLLVYRRLTFSHEANKQARSDRSNNGDTEQKVAHSRIDCDLGSPRQGRIQHSIMAKRKGCNNPPKRIDDCGNPTVGGANQWQSLLDSANPGLLEMLVGTGADPKPSVVGQIQEPAGPLSIWNRFAGKNSFVADEW